MMVQLHPLGIAIGVLILASIYGTLYWMTHPPSTRAERVARVAEAAGQFAGKRAQELFLENFNRLVKLVDEGFSEAGGPDSP
ncbi:MAG: hypothetical protein ACREJX_04165, partial [Polyangiaceae bacterium]